ncbi:Uncharacterised protein [Legionella pneumophila]|uniref:Response regulator receiver n=11 Tax=Legionellaceae TaxID=444 RepID=A0A378KPI1_9GAMM|nr:MULTISPECIES: hypothetical protein [Legionellaceae]AMV16155.1 hypothetical protein ULM_35040 [Legionella pneumophila]AUH74100.1 hypothetical protein CAB17_19240 [Legionella sainthelensi]KTC67614.1 Response regulator receiver [Legionella anisa]KTC82842.1 Response regulator receiver [Legionella cherrii]KTD01067.1 Response regulator receiver [Fluoribacter gormanii]
MNYSFRFLVAEASFPARIIIRNQLMQLGQHVDIVPSIEDTLMQITSKSYDMLLIDSYLYYSQGDYDWTALIKKHHPFTTAPVIALICEHPPIKNEMGSPHLCSFRKPFSEEKAIIIIHYLESTLS